MNKTPCPPPTLDELVKVINSMKNGKASGIDRIPAEVWKIPQVAIKLHSLITQVWEAKTIPSEWRKAVIVPVPKPKENAFRPISLLVVAHKVYLKLLLRRIEQTIEQAAGPTQAGFLSRRSTMDHIMYLRRLRERALEFNLEKWIVLSDVKSAFDTVNRSAVLNILTNAGLGMHMLELIEDSMKCTEAIVRSTENESSFSPMNNGVPQGSSLSPSLFIAALGFSVQYANNLMRRGNAEGQKLD